MNNEYLAHFLYGVQSGDLRIQALGGRHVFSLRVVIAHGHYVVLALGFLALYREREGEMSSRCGDAEQT
jgi:hypothetical protein